MFADMYYLLTAFSLVFFFFVVFFTEDEIIKIDRMGREYDATIFIVAPLCILSMVLHVVLAFQSWNIETLYITGQTVNVYTSDLMYFVPVHIFLFFVHVALFAKNVFDFWIGGLKEPRNKRSDEY